MKVLCIDNSEKEFTLTIGKYYDIIPGSTQSNIYLIENDMGHKHHVLKDRFKTLEEVRDEKLNELGI
jgi:hypothetical protein